MVKTKFHFEVQLCVLSTIDNLYSTLLILIKQL